MQQRMVVVSATLAYPTRSMGSTALVLAVLSFATMAAADVPRHGTYTMANDPRAQIKIEQDLKSCGQVASRIIDNTHVSVSYSDNAIFVNHQEWIREKDLNRDLISVRQPDSSEDVVIELLFGRDGSTARGELIFQKLDKKKAPTCVDVRALIGTYAPGQILRP